MAAFFIGANRLTLDPSFLDMPVSSESSGSAITVYRRELIRPTLYRRVKWRVETAAYAMLEFLLGSLPLAWVARIGHGLGAVAYACLKARRDTVLRNLRIAFAGEKSIAEINLLSRDVFRRSGANLLTSLCTARLAESGLTRAVKLHNEEAFSEALAKGKGVVMVLAHMGNWEALAQWFPRLLPEGVEGATVYRPLNNPIMNARVAAQRRRLGVGLFSKDDNPLGMASFLRRGGVLGVLSDQRAGQIGELVPFFGRLTSCTPIPAILAKRTGAAVLGVSLRSIGLGRWELGFHKLDEGVPTTMGVMDLVERMMRVSPADVFWLQDRWKVSRHSPHLQAGKPARGGEIKPIKRRRALLWSDGTGAMSRPPVARPDDVFYEEAGTGSGIQWVQGVGESEIDFLSRVDAGHALPLDFVVGGGAGVRRACHKLGLGWLEEMS